MFGLIVARRNFVAAVTRIKLTEGKSLLAKKRANLPSVVCSFACQPNRQTPMCALIWFRLPKIKLNPRLKISINWDVVLNGAINAQRLIDLRGVRWGTCSRNPILISQTTPPKMLSQWKSIDQEMSRFASQP